MASDRQAQVGPGIEVTHFDDPLTDRWRTRMSWSLLVAGAAHGAIFGLWPLPQAVAPLAQPEIALDDPIWVTPFEAGGDDGLGADAITIAGPVLPPAAEGEGMTTADGAQAPILVQGPGAANEGEGAGADETIRELLRRTGGAPTMADAGSGLAGLEFQTFLAEGENNPLNRLSGRGASARRPGSPDPSATDRLTADEQSALDMALERLAGFSPEVALEATSSWVLIRNPRDVERFMGQHSIRRLSAADADVDEGAVAVALWIDARGSVEWAEIIQSSGRQDLDDLALQLFNDVVRFRPARLAGVLTPMSAIFSVNFSWF
jgi:TonB family protein